jgi:hypothetical protein
VWEGPTRKHLLALHCSLPFYIYNFIRNRSVKQHKYFWNGCCLLCVIFKHWKLKRAEKRVYKSQVIRHAETFLRSALFYKSLHMKFSQNNFNSNVMTLRISWLWTHNCTDLEKWNWVLVEWIKFILLPSINEFFCYQN